MAKSSNVGLALGLAMLVFASVLTDSSGSSGSSVPPAPAPPREPPTPTPTPTPGYDPVPSLVRLGNRWVAGDMLFDPSRPQYQWLITYVEQRPNEPDGNRLVGTKLDLSGNYLDDFQSSVRGLVIWGWTMVGHRVGSSNRYE